MTDHEPLPVAGYTTQSDESVALVNRLKDAEERYLRLLDELQFAGRHDQQFVGLARQHMQTANMFAVRAIFQPTRVVLPGDVN